MICQSENRSCANRSARRPACHSHSHHRRSCVLHSRIVSQVGKLVGDRLAGGPPFRAQRITLKRYMELCSLGSQRTDFSSLVETYFWFY